MYYSETTVQNLVRVLDEQVTRFQFRNWCSIWRNNRKYQSGFVTPCMVKVPTILAQWFLEGI